MSFRIGLIVVLLGALYGASLLPEHYREQGRSEIRAQVENAVKVERAVRTAENDLLRANYKRELKGMQDAHQIELANARSFYRDSGGLHFNKTRICAGEVGTKTEATSSSIGIDQTSTTELLPEPYSTDLKKLMLEADEIVASCRVIQSAIEKNDLIEIVP